MRTLLTGTGIVILFLLLARSFHHRLPAGERQFVRRWTSFAFLLYAGLFYWTYQTYLHGDFLYGDSEGYHTSALGALSAFADGDYLLQKNPIPVQYVGYPAYFIAPIYAIGGTDQRLPVLLNFVLLLHVAIMLYWMTAGSENGRREARYVYFFALFNPVAISLALYLRKDVLILWLLALMLHQATTMRRNGLRLGPSLVTAGAFLALTILRLPYALMALAAVLVGLSFRVLDTPVKRLLLLPPAVLATVLLARDPTALVLAGAERYMSSSYYEETVFSAATTPQEAILLALRTPMLGISYAFKVLLGTLSGGFAPIRGLTGWSEYLTLLQIDRIGSGLGALWGMSQLPITVAGLVIVLRRRRAQMAPLLIFTGSLMVILFVIGYGSRWGLPGALLVATCWGVGFRRFLDRQTTVSHPALSPQAQRDPAA
jgi:hypothetical protein